MWWLLDKTGEATANMRTPIECLSESEIDNTFWPPHTMPHWFLETEQIYSSVFGAMRRRTIWSQYNGILGKLHTKKKQDMRFTL